MSAYISSTFKLVKPLLSPTFYKNNYDSLIAFNRKEFSAGSIKPFFLAMGAVLVVGYTMEYTFIGSKSWSCCHFKYHFNIDVFCSGFHVIEKQKIVKKALEGHHH